METDVIESAIVAAGGFGAYQLRTLVILTIPLISLTGLWQFPIFYGMSLPHECAEVNNTKIFVRHINENYTDCMMNSTYVSEFELYCDQKFAAPWLASAANIGGLIGHLFWGVCQDIFGRRASTITCSMLTFTFALGGFFLVNHRLTVDIQPFVTCQISRSTGCCLSTPCFLSCGSCLEYAQMAWGVIHFRLN
jgi:MFS family permease